MHLPDGFLSAPVTAAAAAAAVTGLAAGARGAIRTWGARAGATAAGAAAVFAAQAANFPVASGVSAHVLGGALLGASLGFAPAVALVAPVVVVQALLGDGGLLALGANLLTMAVVAPAVAAFAARGGSPARRGAAAALGTFAAVAVCSLLLVLSGRGPASALFGDLLTAHVPVAAAEALGAAGLAWFLARRGDVVARPARFVAAAAAVCVAAAFCAVSTPDALERAAERHGFADLAR